ncbi:MAG: DUF4266 domain-containing protein [Gammaproteobacteria bacterium]|nr:DUF4266 domain-containing protein [Gammaproteobacteria bacterium]
MNPVKPVIVPVLLSLCACNTVPTLNLVQDVKPWERGLLAQQSLQLEPDAMDSFADEHIYFSREASTGGNGVGGGGCGCN